MAGLLVSHGGILESSPTRCSASRARGTGARRRQRLDLNGGAVGGAWRLERWNDTLHLLGREPTHVDESEGRPLAL